MASSERRAMTDPSIDEFDYVVVGAGAAGCLLANRLTADGKTTVCVIEAGPKDNSPYLHIPGGFIKAVSNPKYTWQFYTEPSDGTGGRRINVLQGRTLGGSSAINGLNYNRGQAADFDGWAQQGNLGWGYSDILPYFKRTERRIGEADEAYRGRSGELPITDCDWRHPLCEAFIAAAEDVGFPRNPDYNGRSQAGVGYYQRWIHRGFRYSAARAFLRPSLRRSNLDVRVEAQAVSIRFEGRRAVGVLYVQRPQTAPREIRARREIILSAGTANTPKLLQISGVGPGALLQTISAPVVHELPGVGANLRDHYLVRMVSRVSGLDTINDMTRGVKFFGQIARWAVGAPSILAISPSVVGAFGNGFDLGLEPNLQFVFTPGSYQKSVSGKLDAFPGATLGAYQMRPESVGYVRARSTDPFENPEIQPNYLSHALDRATALSGIRMIRRIFAAPELARYCVQEVSPGASVDSDEGLLDFARAEGNTAYHLIGTCRMGPAAREDTVVDNRLRVHGTDGLRIVDASIMPTMPSANTAAAVFMIAEKASDMILADRQ
jgi:choline dehydrogenase